MTLPVREPTRRLFTLCFAASLLPCLYGCEVSVNRYVEVRLPASAQREGALLNSDEEAAFLDVVDGVARQWQFTRYHTGRGVDGHLRGYERAVRLPGEPGSSLLLNVTRKPPADLRVHVGFFNGSREVELMRDVRLDLTRRLVERFGAERVHVDPPGR